MAKYYGTYSCGHEGCVNIIGPMKDRQWKIDNAFSKLCPECYQKRREEENREANQKALEKAKEMELPELVGSEKQIAWANTIRQGRVELLEKVVDLLHNFDKILKDGKISSLEAKRNDLTLDFWMKIEDFTEKLEDNKLGRAYDYDKEDPEGFKRELERYVEILDYMVCNKKEAKFYIDYRNSLDYSLIEIYKKLKETPEKEKLKEIEKELDEECTVYPDTEESNPVVKIKVDSNKIKLVVEKNEKFREIVRDNRYQWENHVWQRTIPDTAGKVIDRVAEIGNKLLNAGFPVRIEDAKAREMAINGEYKKEQTRWIKYKNKKFYITWNKADDLYDTIRTLPGSKYDKPYVTVPKERYREVEDFAEVYGFEFDLKAQVLLKKMEGMLKLEPKRIIEEKIEEKGLDAMLESDNNVLSDLEETEREGLENITPEETLKFMKKNHFRKHQMAFNAKGDFYGWFEDDELVGIVSTLHTKNTVRIKGFMVDEEWRGKGIGTKILETVMSENKKYTAFVTEQSYPIFNKLEFQEERKNQYNIRFMTKEINEIKD